MTLVQTLAGVDRTGILAPAAGAEPAFGRGRRAGQDRQGRVRGESAEHACEQPGREDAIVVGEADEAAARQGEAQVARVVGMPPRRAFPAQRQPVAPGCHHRRQAVIGILVDHEHLEIRVALRRQALEQCVQLAVAATCRHDQADLHAASRAARSPSTWARNRSRKAAAEKRRRIRPAGGGVDDGRQRLEALDRRGDRGGALLGEEDAGLRPDDVARAAAAIGDQRRAAGLGLDHADAEILLRGVDEGAGGTGQPHQLGLRHPAAQRDVGRAGRGLPHQGGAWPIAADHQLAVRHGAERLDHQLDPLVGHHAGGDQVMAIPRLAQGEAFDIDRRVDDGGGAAPDLLDPLGDVAAVGDEAIHAGGGGAVPMPHPVQQPAGIERHRPALEPGLPQVLVLQVPGIAHRAVDVADMQLARPGDDALGHRMVR